MNNISLDKLVKKYNNLNKNTFSGYLMYKDIKIAKISQNNLIEVYKKDLLPVIMLNEEVGSFESWLETRVIDTHRTNSRHIRRRLSLKTEIPNEIVINSRAVSITDNYWLMFDNENKSFIEIREKLSDGLNTIALYGNDENVVFNIENITPELTNIGSFEKCWKLFDKNWYMIKKGSYKENFAEVLVSKIAKSLNFPVVEYTPIENGKLVKCKDFTENATYDFEPMFSFVRDYWEMDNSIKIIDELGYIKEFLNIIFVDALCYNIDRHTFNFGFLRKDGQIIGIAPNFDNNLALSGVLDDMNLEKTWYSTSFTKHNYIPILQEYNYKCIDLDLNKIKTIINDTLQYFPTLKSDENFKKTIYKIIEGNYMELKKTLH